MSISRIRAAFTGRKAFASRPASRSLPPSRNRSVLKRGTAGALAVVLLVTVALGACLLSGAGCANGKKSVEMYHCPMHPTYISDRPGDCPICGMRLVPIKGSEAQAVAKKEAAEEKAAGVDGGARTARNAQNGTAAGQERTGASGQTGTGAGSDKESGRRILYYRSPMDPTVTSPVPAKDQMGMDFVPVYADEGQPSGQSQSAGEQPSGGIQPQPEVPGYAPVTISPQGMELAGVRTTSATRGVLRRTVRAVGLVVPDERRVHQLTLKSAGYVERLFVGATGQVVRKGDPIVSIYSPDLLAAEAEYLHARDAARTLSASDLPEVRSGADQLLQSSRQRLILLDVPESLIREIERTGTPQRDVTFTAPVSGYVTAKPVLAGMQVEPGTELYTVTDLSKVWIEADFYEYEAPYLKMGQEATLTLPYDPSTRLTGRVALILPVLDAASRTVKVRFETDNPGTALKPGMYANVELAIQSEPGILVPDDAVMDTGQRQLVFVQTAAGRFTPRAVRVGLRGDGQALLLEGVAEGEPVVTQANFLLDSESKIRAAAEQSGAGR